MLAWYLASGAAFFAVLALYSTRRIRALSADEQSGALRYDPLEAGFAAERLKVLLGVRRAAVMLCAFCAVGAWLSRR
jgi:hypothetical protein